MDATGATTDTYDYDAWGNAINVTGSTPNVYLYRGEQYDSSLGLYSLRARYYNPLAGRFVTRDPAKTNAIEPDTLQKYSYADEDPIDRIDPTGWTTASDGAQAGLLMYTAGIGGYDVAFSPSQLTFPHFPQTIARPANLWDGGCGCSGGGYPRGSSLVTDARTSLDEGRRDRCNPCAEQGDIQKRIQTVRRILNSLQTHGGEGGGTPIMHTDCMPEWVNGKYWGTRAITTLDMEDYQTKHPCLFDCAVVHEAVHTRQCINLKDRHPKAHHWELEIPAYNMELGCLILMLTRNGLSPL
jgi:RHS repeat-associated protein